MDFFLFQPLSQFEIQMYTNYLVTSYFSISYLIGFLSYILAFGFVSDLIYFCLTFLFLDIHNELNIGFLTTAGLESNLWDLDRDERKSLIVLSDLLILSDVGELYSLSFNQVLYSTLDLHGYFSDSVVYDTVYGDESPLTLIHYKIKSILNLFLHDLGIINGFFYFFKSLFFVIILRLSYFLSFIDHRLSLSRESFISINQNIDSTLTPWSISWLDVSLTKMHVSVFFVIVYFSIFLVFCFKNSLYYRRNWNVVLFGVFNDFLTNTIIQQLGVKKGQIYSLFLKTVFFVILFYNLFGLIPFSFTVTSHLIFTFGMSLSIWSGLTILGFFRQGFSYFQLIVPSGVPVYMLPIIVPIEFVSYIARAFSLAIRLFANMMSGHTLLYILSGFIVKIAQNGLLFISLFPFFIVFLVTLLEFGIAFLQAYVFFVLTCCYMKDSFSAAH